MHKPAGLVSENGSLNLPLCLTGRLKGSKNLQKVFVKTQDQENHHGNEREKKERE